jgi:hypothetical protein
VRTDVWLPLMRSIGGRSWLMISSQLMYCLADTLREGTEMVLKKRGEERVSWGRREKGMPGWKWQRVQGHLQTMTLNIVNEHNKGMLGSVPCPVPRYNKITHNTSVSGSVPCQFHATTKSPTTPLCLVQSHASSTLQHIIHNTSVSGSVPCQFHATT